MTEPTDAEILDLWESFVGEPTEEIPLSNSDKLCFARAALRSWGQPSGAGEPVAWRYRMKGDLQWQYTERPEQFTHADEVQELTTPQPTQAVPPAGREPLTCEQIQDAAPKYYVEDFLDFSAGARFAEQHHGVNAKEAGNAE